MFTQCACLLGNGMPNIHLYELRKNQFRNTGKGLCQRSQRHHLCNAHFKPIPSSKQSHEITTGALTKRFVFTTTRLTTVTNIQFEKILSSRPFDEKDILLLFEILSIALLLFGVILSLIGFVKSPDMTTFLEPKLPNSCNKP